MHMKDFFSKFGEIISCVNGKICGNHDYIILARGNKTFFMINSAGHEISPAHKCLNANSI